MPQITVTSGWTRPDNYFSQPNGAYPVTLKGIGATDERGTFTPGATYEHTGQFGLKVKQSWVFGFANGEVIEAGVTAPKDGRIHPNSTYYGYASALVGKNPAAGVSFNSDALVGLKALAFIQRDDNDIPRITTLAALQDVTIQTAPTPEPVPAPAAQPVAAPPLREQVAATQTADALPF